MLHCDGAIELLLRQGAAGDREVDLAKSLFGGPRSREVK
jgi:hypothetical protein